ncbi:hypothetical protein GCM10028802_01180 [Terrabacter terrigena]
MMLVDCQTCPVRDVHCADCMVTALTATPLRLGGTRPSGGGLPELTDPAAAPPATVPLDRAERRAVSAFLAAGLVTTATANATRAELAQDVRVVPERPHDARWAG